MLKFLADNHAAPYWLHAWRLVSGFGSVLTSTMGMISKLLHYSADLALLSTVIAGVRRSTGLTPKVDSIENAEARSLVAKYFEAGEWIFDTSSSLMAGSSYFERRIR